MIILHSHTPDPDPHLVSHFTLYLKYKKHNMNKHYIIISSCCNGNIIIVTIS